MDSMGEYIKERRLALSMSQEDLAESAGTSAAYLSQIERGKVALPGADLHFDHVIPLARGGPHSEENIRPSHALCNLRKGAKLLENDAA